MTAPLTDERRDLAAANVGLAIHLAAPFKRSIPRLAEEFESAAYLGLVDAASTWPGPPGVAFTTWAWPRIRHALRKALRHDRRRPADDPLPELVPDHREPPAGRALEDADRVEHLARNLSPKLREVLRLLYREGLTMRQAGARLGHDQPYISRLHAKALRSLANT